MAKALWVIFVIVLPYFGVFIYLIARGQKMNEHAMEAAQAQDAARRCPHRERSRHRAEQSSDEYDPDG